MDFFAKLSIALGTWTIILLYSMLFFDSPLVKKRLCITGVVCAIIASTVWVMA